MAKENAKTVTKKPKPPESGSPHYIVGVGASAGGLEALRALFGAIPAKCDFSFVVVQHLAPLHRSRLVELIAHTTPLKVKEAQDGEVPASGVVYITPPNKDVFYEEGVLRLRPPELKIGPKPSVDLFFQSLAENRGEDSIGIVLSGTGTDGSHGIRAIKAAGGITISQKLDSAKYDGMPKAAKLTGSVDLELTPEEIAAELARFEKLNWKRNPATSRRAEPRTDDFEGILDLVARQHGVDFAEYKQSTVLRRVQRRMVANRCETIGQYSKFLKKNPQESKLLLQDVLISVTSFFRDPPAFAALKKRLYLKLRGKKAGGHFRAWVVGCATGEEAYSIAILISEILEELKLTLSIQIFATDLDDQALAIARKGNYSKASFAGAPASLVKKYFTVLEDRLQVRGSLRDWCVFTHHNVASDPPFLNQDLITCRNVLIYFNPRLQDRVFTTLHYALDSRGILFLGRSEAASGHEDRFSLVDKTNKLYTRLQGRGEPPKLSARTSQPGTSLLRGARGLHGVRRNGTHPDPEQPQLPRTDGLSEPWIAALAPDSVLVNERFELQVVYGKAGTYLVHPKGVATQQLSKLVLKELGFELLTLLHRAEKTQKPAHGRDQALSSRGKGARRAGVRQSVAPIKLDGRTCYLVSFTAIEMAAPPVPGIRKRAGASSAADERRTYELEQDLHAAREQLQAVIEERETGEEELQALNEELQSANEELQSSNEEFETTNEELQSSNEELTTLNQELNVKSTELSALNLRLQAIQNAIVYPLLIFDRNRNLVNFNPAARHLFRVNDTDVGTHFRALPSPIDLTDIYALLERALSEGSDQRQQFAVRERSFEVQIQLYRGHKNAIDGAVISFVENTAIVTVLEENRLSRQRLSDILENTPAMVTMKDLSGVYVYANRRFCEAAGVPCDQVIAQTDEELFGKELGEALRSRDLEAIRRKETIQFEEQLALDGKTHFWASSRFPIFDTQGRVQRVCTVALDISARILYDRQQELFRKAIASANGGIAMFESEGPGFRATFVSEQLAAFCSSDPMALQGETLESLLGRLRILGNLDKMDKPDKTDRGTRASEIAAQIAARARYGVTLRVEREEGTDGWVELRSSLVQADSSDQHRHVILALFDVTDKISDQKTILQQQDELARFSRFSALGEISAGIAHEINTPLNVIITKTDFMRKLAERGRLDEAAARKVGDDIDRITQNISSIVQGLKAVASGEATGEFRPTRISQLIQDTLKICEFKLHRLGVEIEITGKPEALSLECDPVQICQILINLVSNSLDAIAEREERWIRIHAERSGPNVQIIVTDSGDGIRPEVAEKIMTPFFTTKKKGTGIGLSLSRTIARRHGGDLLLNRKVKNTSFTLELPQRKT